MPLSADAHAALAEQIETLNPSAAVLESKGIDWETAATLVRFIKSGQPDMAALKDHGLPLETAISICQAISAHHARRAAALALAKPMPAASPKPMPAAPAPKPDGMDGMSAMSMLHTLCEQAVSGRYACITTLMNDGWSESTSRELVKIINASLTIQRPVK
ncbi:hypothetical protein SAMN05443247_07620 [Bradyrhizobium erythrophlei]|nr:hypothetical protein SAMN05443247_07620 [Bradyrhizobium erythrophlei]